MIANNLELIRACCNVSIYLSISTVSIGHIVCGVTGIPISTHMCTRASHGEGSLLIASGAKVRSIESVTESRNYGVLTIKADLRSSTGCFLTKIGVQAGRTEGRPGSAAAIPSTFLNGVVVCTGGRDGKVFCLVPLIVPDISSCAGIHTAEDNVGINLICRNSNLIDAVAVRVGHTYPSFSVTEEVSCETSITLLPIGIGSEIKCLGLFCSTCGKHCQAHQECENYEKSNKDFACELHSKIPFLYLIIFHAVDIIPYLGN